MLRFLLTYFLPAHAEEIDLGDLGMDDFTPYVYDREPLWVLVPILMLLFVCLHLMKPKPEENNQ